MNRYGIDAWGRPAVLSGLGAPFPIAFVLLRLPLLPREMPARSVDEAVARPRA